MVFIELLMRRCRKRLHGRLAQRGRLRISLCSMPILVGLPSPLGSPLRRLLTFQTLNGHLVRPFEVNVVWTAGQPPVVRFCRQVGQFPRRISGSQPQPAVSPVWLDCYACLRIGSGSIETGSRHRAMDAPFHDIIGGVQAFAEVGGRAGGQRVRIGRQPGPRSHGNCFGKCFNGPVPILGEKAYAAHIPQLLSRRRQAARQCIVAAAAATDHTAPTLHNTGAIHWCFARLSRGQRGCNGRLGPRDHHSSFQPLQRTPQVFIRRAVRKPSVKSLCRLGLIARRQEHRVEAEPAFWPRRVHLDASRSISGGVCETCSDAHTPWRMVVHVFSTRHLNNVFRARKPRSGAVAHQTPV